MAIGEESVIPVRVAIRVRPLVTKEKDEGAAFCTQCDEETNQISIGGKLFTFNYVFGTKSTQESVYDDVAHPLTERIFNGYNCTVFAYGQTGSGKTYTMGTEETEQTCGTESAGIIPRIVDSIFARVQTESDDFSFVLKCSMLEIYDEKVFDLFGDTREKMDLRDQPGGVIVQGLSESIVESTVQTMRQLEKGCQVRSKGETAMNSQSSRSHAIFTLFLYKTDLKDESNSFQAKLNLVDLAGSERLSKTQAAGQRMKEGIKINGGLLALGNVISALSENQNFTPYRDSKLTRLLRDSLGGNSYTVMIACASPADSNYEETMSTLRYAERAMKIKNKPIVNKDPKAAEIASLRMKVQKLEHDLLLYKAGKEPEVGQLAQGGISKVRSELSAANYAEFEGLRRQVKTLTEEKKKMNEQMAELAAERLKCLEMALKNEQEKDKLNERHERTVETLRQVIAAAEEEDLSEDSRDRALHVLRDMLKELLEEDEEVEEDIKNDEVSSAEESEEDDDEEGAEYPEKFVRKQSVMGKQIEDLMRQIMDKEKIVSQTVSSQEEMEQLRANHEKQMSDFHKKIAELEKQRDELNKELRKKDNHAKLAEDRRRKLAETEKLLSDYRKKLQDLKKLEKVKVQSEQNIKKLREEIAGLKNLRVKLVRQLREESDKYRQWKLRYEREMNQIKQQERKREFEAQKTKQKYDQSLAVYKRKYEEALSFGKRLRQQLDTQRVAGQSRFDESKMNENTIKQIKRFLEGELTSMAACEEAKIHHENLVEQRKELNHQLKKAEEKLQRIKDSDQPPRKKKSLAGGRSEDSDSSRETLSMELLKEIEELNTEVELRSSEINNLQSQITTFDVDAKTKQRWTNLYTVSQAKCYLQELFNMALCSKMDYFTRDEEWKELRAQLESLETAMKKQKTQSALQKRRVENQHSALVEALDKEKTTHQSEMCCILKMMSSLVQGKGLSEDELRKMEEMNSKLDNKEELLELLERREVENQELQNELCKEKVKGSRSKPFFKSITSSRSNLEDGENEEASMCPPPIGLKRSRSSRVLLVPQRWGQLVDSENTIPIEEEEDMSEGSEDDESYHETPLQKRVKKITRDVAEKRQGTVSLFGHTSSAGCRCKSDCKTGRCGCRKQNSFCDSMCSCRNCVNKERDEEGNEENRQSVKSVASTSSADSYNDTNKAPVNTTFSAKKSSSPSPLNDETFDADERREPVSPVIKAGLGSFLGKRPVGGKFFKPVTPKQ